MEDYYSCNCGAVLDRSVCQKCPVCKSSHVSHTGLSKYTDEEKKARKEYFRKQYYKDHGLEYKPLNR